MAIEKINIENFLKLAEQYPVIDVRSPGEFSHAQIPGAHSLPLFTDEERKIVGTAYKQQSRKDAIKIGLDFFGIKMKKLIEEAEALIVEKCLLDSNKIENNQQLPTKSILVHCWRGGMRSEAVAWLLDMYGYKVYTLAGGYKSFRNWVLQQFDKDYTLKILGGYTGSGKTIVLQQLKQNQIPVIDLENLANHKGSAFGAIGQHPQPSQEMFENLLAVELYKFHTSAIWLEDESQRIGKLIIPNSLWIKMRNSPVYFLEIPFEERLHYLVNTYGNFEQQTLIESIERIQKRLGGLETQTAINFLMDGNITASFRILLKYYDKLYQKGLQSRKNYQQLLNIIQCPGVNTSENVNKLSLQEA